ncbi:MAG TPA: hypothetical protein PKE69_11790 [Pyrinomonadaceae bacterium]|mgnify:CR=1 FL=1|nr:hypothetical protein [Pyrinomonadaceae bacterium]
MTQEDILKAIEQLDEAKQVRFSQLLKICEQFFGNYRVSGSHHIFKTPWQGDPRINLQKGKDRNAKPYQVRQVLNALRKLKELEEDKKNEQNK